MPSYNSSNKSGVFKGIDWYLILLYLALVGIGLLSIYSSVYNENNQSIFSFAERYGKQMIWIAFALFIGFSILLIDPKFFTSFSFVFYGASVVLLILVLIVGKEINNAKSWFQIGSFALQPSEIAKFATALMLAKYMSTNNFDIKKRSNLFVSIAIIFAPSAFIMLQPDMGSAIVFAALMLVLYREGLKAWMVFGAIYMAILFILALMMKNFVLSTILFAIGVVLIIIMKGRIRESILIGVITVLSIGFVVSVDYIYSNVLAEHQKARIDVYIGSLKGEDIDITNVGYNFYQSKVAIGSGGFAGKGYLKGTQTKMDFIPEQDTDFIFCTIGEEWGFAGSFLVVSLFALLLIRIVLKAEKQRSKFSRIYGYSVASILFFHFLINIGMTIGLVPVIGIPLPFLSYGGSSLWSFTILLFIFIKQDSHRNEVI